MHKLSTTWFTLLALGTLNACGGGGGGGDSNGNDPNNSGPPVTPPVNPLEAPVKITALNGEAVVRTVWTARNDVGDTITSIVEFNSGILDDQAGGGPLLGQPRLCEGGGTVTPDFSGNFDQSFDPGESISIDYDQCAQAGQVLNGIARLTLINRGGDIVNQIGDWFIETQLDVINLTLSSAGAVTTLDGSLTLFQDEVQSTGLSTTRAQGAQLSHTANGQPSVFKNFTLARTRDSALPANYTADDDFTYSGQAIGGTVIVLTDPILSGQVINLVGQNIPESGKLSLIGADNSKAVVEATGSGLAAFSVDGTGDGDFIDPEDLVIPSISWLSLFPDE